MTKYIVHLYREMRLSYTDIEADTPEAAALVTRDRPTGDACDIDDCEGETFDACVDVAGDEEYEHSRWIDFEGERVRKAAPKLLAACRMVVDRWERGDLAEAARACSAAIAGAEAAGITPTLAADTLPGGLRPYSVLLLYPDYAGDGGTETYYAFVEATDAIAAAAAAQRQAAAAQSIDIDDPTDFHPLLVTQGHHASEPLFNK